MRFCARCEVYWDKQVETCWCCGGYGAGPRSPAFSSQHGADNGMPRSEHDRALT